MIILRNGILNGKNLQCEIEDLNELQGIDIGDTVIVNGYCLGENGLSINIDNCEIKEIQPQRL